MYPLAARTLRLLLVVTALSAVVLHAMEPTLTSTTDIELGRWIQPIVYERRKRETVIRERLEAVQATRNDIERAAAYVLTMLNLTNVTEDLRNYSRDAINTALDSIQANLESEMRRNVERYLAWLGDGSPDVELAQLFRFSWAQAYQDYLQRHRDEPPPYRTSRNNFAPLADPVDWARSVIIRPMRSYSAMTLKVQYVPGPLSGVTVADECTNATAAEDRAAMKDALLQRHYKRLRETVADALDPNVEMLPFSERLGSFVQGLQNKSSGHRPSGRIVGSVVVVSTRRWANVRQFADVILKPDAILQAWNIYYAKRAIPHPLIEPYDFLMTVADELTLAASANAGNLTGLQRLIFEPDSSRTRRQFFDVSLLGLPPYDQLPLDSWWNNGTVREFVHDRIHRFVDGSNKTSYLHSREKLHLVTELKMGSAFTGVINFYSRRRIDPRTQDEGFTSDATVRAQMHFSMFLSSLTGKTSLAAETAERLAQLASRADYDVNFDIVSLGHSVRTSPVGLEELIAKMNTYDAGTFTASGSGESESTMQARRQSNMASVIEAAIKALNGVAQSDPAVSLRSFSAALEDFAQREEQEGVGVPIGFRVQSFTRLDVLAMLASDTVLPEWRNFVGPSLNALPPTAYARLRNMVLQRALQFADNQTVTPLP